MATIVSCAWAQWIDSSRQRASSRNRAGFLIGSMREVSQISKRSRPRSLTVMGVFFRRTGFGKAPRWLLKSLEAQHPENQRSKAHYASINTPPIVVWLCRGHRHGEEGFFSTRSSCDCGDSGERDSDG